MAYSTKDTLVEALEGKPTFDEGVKNKLAYYLSQDGVDVFDSVTGTLDGLEGIYIDKRKRGRPRNDSRKEQYNNSLSKEALREDMKEKARKIDRINPKPTEEQKKFQDINADLREVEWDMADLPDSRNDAMSMLADIDNLRDEAGIDKLDDSFPSYAEYRNLWNGYYKLKKESRELLDAIKNYIENKDLKKAKEIIISLKDNINEMNGRYGKVIDSYEKLCSELMSIADSRDDWRGSSNPASTETMKNGFGMIEGEDGKKYEKRMRSLGRWKDIPKTITGIDDRIAQTERRWRSVAGISPDEFKVIKENWQKSWRALSGKISVASNMKISDLNGILEGRYGKKKRGRKPENEEDELMSDLGDRFVSSIGESCFSKDGEIRYGVLHTLNPVDGDNDVGGEYGQIVVRWKPQSVVATILFGNSLDMAAGSSNGMMPSLLSEPSPCSFAPENRTLIDMLKSSPCDLDLKKVCDLADVPYVEVQMHGSGGYKAEDIQSISFGSEDDYLNVSAMGDTIVEEFGIPLYIGGKPIEDEEGEEERSQEEHGSENNEHYVQGDGEDGSRDS